MKAYHRPLLVVAMFAMLYGAFMTGRVLTLESRVAELERQIDLLPLIASVESAVAVHALEHRLQPPRIVPLAEHQRDR